ncbi:MurR/RpiR family transcriptional regulator [Thomasclavelia sp.]|uniref:MurR/RpiR family transcriptional regulator n=1 Tax=Thomasclavelia sp. TaxID=3025757 RepID=UPI0025DF50C5|nr:MurR/RpiR family transcriptional regulator [Thomasclavelia sp.]
MEKTVMDTICSSFDNFFDSEKKIAKYIINHYDQVVDMTVGQLAKASGSSEASVSRFCKKIGVKGFHHLKISLAKEMVESDINEGSVSNNISFDEISQSLQNILVNKIEELKQTVSMMDNDQLPIILQKILKARSVQFVAVGNTIPVAIDGTFKFNQIGISAISSTIWENQIGYIYNMNDQDVVIAISNSGESRGVITAIKAAQEVGATTISITNNENSTVAKASDFHITTATREKLFLDGYCFSRVSATTVIEILYLFLTSMNKNAYKSIARHENAIAGDKF